MTLRVRPFFLVLGALASSAAHTACEPLEQLVPTPRVQVSAAREPRERIDINRIRDGVFRPYAPRCVLSVRPGQTVEFRNFLPEINANVTGISGPEPLYSPNLVRPYQYVADTDPSNTLCNIEEDSGCLERPAWSYWRHTFLTPGVYDWHDTNQGAAGRQVVDAYYGTVTFVGIDPDSPIGTICVTTDDGGGCEGICCVTDADCTRNNRCFKAEVDSIGRCLTPSG